VFAVKFGDGRNGALQASLPRGFLLAGFPND